MAVVHHLTYEHIGNEPLEDLQGLCRACHDFLSAESDIDPAERLMFSAGFARLLAMGISEEVVDRSIRRTVHEMYRETPLTLEQIEDSVRNFWEFTRARLRGEEPQI